MTEVSAPTDASSIGAENVIVRGSASPMPVPTTGPNAPFVSGTSALGGVAAAGVG